MKLKKYTEAQLKDAINGSFSLAQTLSVLNVTPAGGNYETVKKAISFYEIDISHFTGKSSNKGKLFGPKRKVEEYLSNKNSIRSYTLKARLIKEKLLVERCDSCKLEVWLSKKIPLELHHIDGNNKNNNLSNLQLLCPNCHAFTDNYRNNK